MKLTYVICDVFAERPLEGNALAVFTDARGLDGATMQALARETNLSETTFVLPPERGGDARARIFTPTRELPFAGHPTLGTAFVVAVTTGATSVRLETQAGVVPVRFDRASKGAGFGWMEQPLPTVCACDDPAPVLAALGVAASLAPVEIYDNGMQHLFVELATPEAVAGVRPDVARLTALTREFGVSTFAASGARWKTRMFAPGLGVLEDPATVSAAGPLALHLARHARTPFGVEVVIEQGAEVGRPSILHARARGAAARVESVEVGGATYIVARGEFEIG